MKKNKHTDNWSDREWAGAAAWLSGEESGSGEDARSLISEEADIMKKWNDLKDPGKEIIDVDRAWAKLNGRIEAESPVIPHDRSQDTVPQNLCKDSSNGDYRCRSRMAPLRNGCTSEDYSGYRRR